MNGDSMPIAGEVCVALDLETTGLVAETDEIIEVGAVKFLGDRALDTFQAPGQPLQNAATVHSRADRHYPGGRGWGLPLCRGGASAGVVHWQKPDSWTERGL